MLVDFPGAVSAVLSCSGVATTITEPFGHFFKDIFLVTCPYRGELRYFRDKWHITAGAVFYAYLKEIGVCTFAGEEEDNLLADLWRMSRNGQPVTPDAINFHSGQSQIALFWELQTSTKSQL
jgi:hypothetical protein